MDVSKLEPDDIRVNPELYHLVQAALRERAEHERSNFDPIKNKRPQEIRRDFIALRLQVIADYQAHR